MLKNAYFLAKIGADTAENEQHFAEILPIGRRVADRPGGDTQYSARHGAGAAGPPRARAPRARPRVAIFWQIFGKMSLVFGCIGTDLCKQIRVFQHFSKSTRLSN